MRTIETQPGLSELVTREIRDAILDGTLAPGARIKQETLAGELRVSRAPIRQALTVLKREGFVQTRRHRGTIVAPLDPAFLSDLYELREAIDGYAAARLAACHVFDSAALWRIVAEGEEAVASADLPRIIELDLSFHFGLYDALGNQPLRNMMAAQWGHFRRAMAATLGISRYRERVWTEHAVILKAIAEGKPASAQAAAITHTRRARVVLLGTLNRVLMERKPARRVNRPRNNGMKRPAAPEHELGT